MPPLLCRIQQASLNLGFRWEPPLPGMAFPSGWLPWLLKGQGVATGPRTQQGHRTSTVLHGRTPPRIVDGFGRYRLARLACCWSPSVVRGLSLGKGPLRLR